MIFLAPIFTLLASTFASSNAAPADHLPTCREIDDALSPASGLYFIGEGSYYEGIAHWASSSSQLAACVVEPGTAADVSIILRIVARRRTPFAVKGGGHAANPGFSSTEGVHIAMSRFSDVVYDPDAQTAAIGAGLIWDDVYAALQPHGVNVVGGRVRGVGVAGFILGGGYSWLSNQYGLTIDTVVSYDLVKPDGDVVVVTQESDSELLFGLKARSGGMNNFGIVTKFTLKTFPQGFVWGGTVTYPQTSMDAVIAATAAFSANVSDPKAGLITSFQVFSGTPLIAALVFYDAPTPPRGIFDALLAIPKLASTAMPGQTFGSLVASFPSDITYGQRGIFHTVSVVEYRADFIRAIANETLLIPATHWGRTLSSSTGVLVSYSVEPFLSTLYTHTGNNNNNNNNNTDSNNNNTSTAFPYSRLAPISPLNAFFSWTSSSNDDVFFDAMRRSGNYIKEVAARDFAGIAQAPLYPNYAIWSTPVDQIWGTALPRLRALKRRIDPDDVMGLAGGFKIVPT